jgi:single-strand DNA-binding protein
MSEHVSFNHVALAGTLTQNVDFKYTANGKALGKFSIYVPSKFKPLYINIVVWGELAERCNARLQKSVAVYIEGAINLNKWEDKEGKKKSTYEVSAFRIASPAFQDDLSEIIPKREYTRKPKAVKEEAPQAVEPPQKKGTFDYYSTMPRSYDDADEDEIPW